MGVPSGSDEIMIANEQRIGEQQLRARRSIVAVQNAHQRIAQQGRQNRARLFLFGALQKRVDVNLPLLLDVALAPVTD